MTYLAVMAANRASLRAYLQERLLPHVARSDVERRMLPEALDAVRGAGLFGANVSADFGGLGLSAAEWCSAHEEVGRTCSSTRSLLTVQNMVTFALARFGDDEQKRNWLPQLASGECLASFALSEPHSGSNTNALRTEAQQVEEGWMLNGRKSWLTGGQLAGLFLVFARVDDGIAAFLVPKSERVRVRPAPEMLGVRASMLAEVDFERVRLPLAARLGPRTFSPGFVLNAALDLGRMSVAAGSAGVIASCLAETVRYAGLRETATGRLYDQQLTKAKIADMVTALHASRGLVADAADKLERREATFGLAAWIAKYYSTRTATKVARDAVQLHGAQGCVSGNAVERHYRDSKIGEIIEGNTELARMVIADNALRAEFA